VATYLAALALAGRANSTITTHSAAISRWHRQDGLAANIKMASYEAVDAVSQSCPDIGWQ